MLARKIDWGSSFLLELGVPRVCRMLSHVTPIVPSLGRTRARAAIWRQAVLCAGLGTKSSSLRLVSAEPCAHLDERGSESG